MVNKVYSSETEGNEKLANSTSLTNIKAIELQYSMDNYDALFQEALSFKEKDVGLKNISTRGRIRIAENGDIEVFSGDAAGIIVNKKYKTTNLYGQAINQNASLIRMNTLPNGLMWNDWWLNPKLYQISDKLNPKMWTGSWGDPLPGPKYMDNLKLSATARWWCPGIPNMCGRHEEPGEHHAGHWVSVQMGITPFFRAWEDIEYRKQLDELGIPF